MTSSSNGRVRFKFVLAAMALAVASSLSIQAFAHPRPAPTKDIVDTAVAAGSFKTLVAALQAAGLVDTLKGKGPYTVFAPTDEAFAKLPAGTVEDLLKPENKAKLTAILTYHVVPGKVMAAQASKMKSAKTVNGESLAISTNGGVVMVDNAKVIKADILCSNGVIHVIDSVVLPKVTRATEREGAVRRGIGPFFLLGDLAQSVTLRQYLHSIWPDLPGCSRPAESRTPANPNRSRRSRENAATLSRLENCGFPQPLPCQIQTGERVRCNTSTARVSSPWSASGSFSGARRFETRRSPREWKDHFAERAGCAPLRSIFRCDQRSRLL